MASKAVAGPEEQTDNEQEKRCWKKLIAARADLKRKQEKHAKKTKLLELANEALATAGKAEKEAREAEEAAQSAATTAGTEYGAFKPGEGE